MKLLSAEFVTGQVRDGAAQVAMAGRSNVGKSTLINALCRAKVARTSAAPGKTRFVNVYRVAINGGPGGPGRWSFYLVDLPGYGYARGGENAADELRGFAEGYFAAAQTSAGNVVESGGGVEPAVRAALLLVDARHPGLESDIAAARWLDGMRVTRNIVATKIDKLSRAERARNLTALETVFGTTALPVSATSGEGLDALWTMIARIARHVDQRG